jgi:hypothetical protein
LIPILGNAACGVCEASSCFAEYRQERQVYAPGIWSSSGGNNHSAEEKNAPGMFVANQEDKGMISAENRRGSWHHNDTHPYSHSGFRFVVCGNERPHGLLSEPIRLTKTLQWDKTLHIPVSVRNAPIFSLDIK